MCTAKSAGGSWAWAVPDPSNPQVNGTFEWENVRIEIVQDFQKPGDAVAYNYKVAVLVDEAEVYVYDLRAHPRAPIMWKNS